MPMHPAPKNLIPGRGEMPVGWYAHLLRQREVLWVRAQARAAGWLQDEDADRRITGSTGIGVMAPGGTVGRDPESSLRRPFG